MPWFIALPCVAAGSVAGHAVGSRLVSPEAHDLLRETHEHAALQTPVTPVLAGFLGALLLVGLALLIRAVKEGRPARSLSPWLFLAAPIAAWPVQEAIERTVHAEGLGAHAVLDPSLVLGVALQIPFGLAAFLLARLLLRVAVAVAGVLTRRGPLPRRRVEHPPAPRVAPRAPRTRVTALGRAQRAPPLAAFA
jgi:hypothetical protein